MPPLESESCQPPPLQWVSHTLSTHWEVCSSGSRGEFLTRAVAKAPADISFAASESGHVTRGAVVLNACEVSYWQHEAPERAEPRNWGERGREGGWQVSSLSSEPGARWLFAWLRVGGRGPA